MTLQPSFGLMKTRGRPNPTLEVLDLDLFGYLGSGRWDLDLLVNDPYPEEEPDSNEDPDLSCDLVVQTFKIIQFCLISTYFHHGFST